MFVGNRIRELEEERTHDRQAATHILLGRGVEVWQQAVTLFDEAPTNCLLFRTVHPNLLVGGAFFRVIAVDRLKRANLDPLGQQLGRRTASEAANVSACKGK